MFKTSIPAGQLWPGQVSQEIGPPPDDSTGKIESIQAVLDYWEDGSIRTSVRLEVEPGELEELRNGAALWVSFLGAPIRPFQVQVLRLAPKPVQLDVLQPTPTMTQEQSSEIMKLLEARGIQHLKDTLETGAVEKGLSTDLVERMLTDPQTASTAVIAVQAGIIETLRLVRELRGTPQAGTAGNAGTGGPQ